MNITLIELKEGIQWYVNNCNITSKPDSIEVRNEGSFLTAKIGDIDEDGYTVSIATNFSVEQTSVTVSNGNELITSNEVKYVTDIINKNGDFKIYLYKTLKELEMRAQPKHRLEREDNRKKAIDQYMSNIVLELNKINTSLELQKNNTGHYPDIENLIKVKEQIEDLLDKVGVLYTHRMEVISSDPLV